MGAFLQDVQYSVRRLLRAPGFAIIAIATIGLGIGANTAIFSFINAALFKSPGGVSEPDRLVSVFTSDYSGPLYSTSSYPDFEELRKERDLFTDAAAISANAINVVRGSQVERLNAELVTANYFSLLGLSPAAGRLLVSADSLQPVIVLSEAIWTERFGRDAALIGGTVTVNGQSYTLVGVAPANFHGMTTGARYEAWLPITSANHIARVGVGERDSRWLAVLARLRPGITVAGAQARLGVLQQQLHQAYPDEWTDVKGRSRSLTVLSEQDARVPPDSRGPVFTLGGLLLVAVALVLLICCANVANLLLARAAAREREIAIRYSLGAHRRTVVRQLLVESLLVALAGGAVGLLLALWLADLLISWQPANGVPVYFDIRPDARVLGFTFVVSLVTGLLFGLAPALQSSRATLLDLLKGERTFSGHRQGRLRDLLVAGQVAIALVLAIGAGLLVRTVQSASRIDGGFDPENVLVATVDLGTAGYDEPRAREFYRALRARLELLPDVQSTALATRIPLAHPSGRRGVRIPDYTPQPGEDMEFPFNVVSADYFEVMQVPIDRGRAFTEADRADAQPVIIVNETFARRFWPGQDPIGKQMSAGGGSRTPRVVVGVARTGRYWQINESPRPYFYLPYEQSFDAMTLHVRVRGNLDQVREAVRTAVRALDPQLPILMLDDMQGQMARAVLPQRIAGLLVGLFALLAILLAAIGVFGVTSVLVAQRIPELGLRIALGAGSREILSLIVGRAMLVAGFGMLAGIAIAAAATRTLESMLFGISRFDPLSFAAAALVLAAAALLASYLPARRALRVDPLIALKS